MFVGELAVRWSNSDACGIALHRAVCRTDAVFDRRPDDVFERSLFSKVCERPRDANFFMSCGLQRGAGAGVMLKLGALLSALNRTNKSTSTILRNKRVLAVH